MTKLFIFLCAFTLMAKELPFCVVIPSFNNAQWFEQNLDSVFDQQYENYRVIYIDDGSSDGTYNLVRDYVKKRGQEDRFTLLKNDERQDPLACMCQGVFLCDKEEIIVDLDGNDWLAHNHVLEKLNQVYTEEDVWVTYGQFTRYPRLLYGSACQVPKEVIESNTFRSLGGAVTHLKTFYAGLFQEIKKEDFLFQDKIIPKAGDLAYIIPILEMAGKHTRFIPGILYVYNYSHPIHFYKHTNDLEAQMDRYVRSKERYSPLDSLPTQTTLPIYSQIGDLNNPSLNDYKFLQDFLTHGHREKLELLADMHARTRQIKIIGDKAAELPRSGVISVNCKPEEKENCILVYSSFNDRYPQGLERLVKIIELSDFKGHILYRLGGWPNTEAGFLTLSHVPYGFKIAFFKEAERLGYKRALWLDAAVVPIVSLNEIFDHIENKGVFVMSNGRTIGSHANEESLVFFGKNLPLSHKIPSCSAGLFGVDFTQRLGRDVINWWHRAALDKDAFFSPRSDQNALSVILRSLGVRDFIGLDKMPHSSHEIKSDSLFWLDREFVH